MSTGKEGVIACLLLAILVSSAFLEVCNGAVWFEGYDPQEKQEIRLSMQHIKQPVENSPTSLPVCILTLDETEPHIVNLTIVVDTAALFYQNENFETWLSIDSQEPEKLFGILDSHGSAAGEMYECRYYADLSALGNGAHSIKIRVVGEYYGPNSGNYDCEGSVTISVKGQPTAAPTPIETPTQSPQANSTLPTLTYAIVAVVAVFAVGIAVTVLLKRTQSPQPTAPNNSTRNIGKPKDMEMLGHKEEQASP